MNVGRAKDLVDHIRQCLLAIHGDRPGSISLGMEVDELLDAGVTMVRLRDAACMEVAAKIEKLASEKQK